MKEIILSVAVPKVFPKKCNWQLQLLGFSPNPKPPLCYDQRTQQCEDAGEEGGPEVDGGRAVGEDQFAGLLHKASHLVRAGQIGEHLWTVRTVRPQSGDSGGEALWRRLASLIFTTSASPSSPHSSSCSYPRGGRWRRTPRARR